MQDHRSLKEAWKKTQTDWQTKQSEVNVGATKEEKIEEGQVVSEKDKKWIQKAVEKPGALKKAHPKMAKGGFSDKELDTIIKDPKSAKDKKRAELAKTLKTVGESDKKDNDGIEYDVKPTNIDLVRAGDTILHNGNLKTVTKNDIKRGPDGDKTIFGNSYKAGNEEVMVAKVKHAKPEKMKEEDGATTTGDVGVPNEVPDTRIGKSKKPQVRTKKEEEMGESYDKVLDRAFKRFVLGDSIVYQEEDDEDMGVEDDLEDVDDVDAEADLDAGPVGDDALPPPEGELSDLPVDVDVEVEPEVAMEPEVPGVGLDPVQARLAAIEARLAAIEAGGAGEAEITDLGDELPAGMDDVAPEAPVEPEAPIDLPVGDVGVDDEALPVDDVDVDDDDEDELEVQD